MAEIKKTEAAVKPVATIKTPVAAEVKTPEVKAPAKTEVKVEAKKPEVKKAAPAKKAAAKKPAAKKAAPKKAATTALKANIVLQYSDKNVTYDTIVTNAKNHYQYDMGGDVNAIKKLSVYVKPEENAAYYVVDDKVQGRIDL